MTDYEPPLDQLLRLGEKGTGRKWLDYAALGIGPGHVSGLIGMATDADLVTAADLDDETAEAYSWAPQHALRALGQLGAVEAAGPLLDGLDRLIDVHDLWVEDLSDAMGKLGPGAIEPCERYLADDSHKEHCRIIASESLEKIALAHPGHRERCIAVLTRQLERHDKDVAALNGFIVSDLIDLKAVESAPAIEAAFAAGAVDETIAGDWPSVRYDLGLGPKPESRRLIELRMAELERGRGPDPGRPKLDRLKKQQKAARKQQRKRKKGR